MFDLKNLNIHIYWVFGIVNHADYNNYKLMCTCTYIIVYNYFYLSKKYIGIWISDAIGTHTFKNNI